MASTSYWDVYKRQPKLIPVVFAGIHYYTDITKSQSPNNSSNGHLKLIEAIQNHDAQTAYNIMFEHINSGIVTMQGVWAQIGQNDAWQMGWFFI